MLLHALAQSLSHLIVHAVFSTKDRRALPGLKPLGYSVFALRATQNVQTCSALKGRQILQQR
jgi:hypothetical protein